MSEFITVARPYAKAAFDFAVEHQSVERWQDMLAFAAEVTKNEQMAELLSGALAPETLAEPRQVRNRQVRRRVADLDPGAIGSGHHHGDDAAVLFEQRLRRRRIATAEVRLVGGNHPAVVEQRGLPGLRPRRDHHHAVVIDVVRADPVARDLRFGRAVLLQKVE